MWLRGKSSPIIQSLRNWGMNGGDLSICLWNKYLECLLVLMALEQRAFWYLALVRDISIYFKDLNSTANPAAGWSVTIDTMNKWQKRLPHVGESQIARAVKTIETASLWLRTQGLSVCSFTVVLEFFKGKNWRWGSWAICKDCITRMKKVVF